MKRLQQHLNKVAEIFYRAGGTTVVICPGSRNAPIIVAFTRHPHIECIAISDERSAAFIALGIAVQTKKPVAILCTSGTATINFYPAICEAFYQQVPLVVITADRPPELIDQWDGQAIRQQHLYQNHILHELNFPYPVQENSMEQLTSEFTATMILALQQQLPIHLNIPLKEPFYPVTNEVYRYDETPIAIQPAELLPTHGSAKDVFDLDDIIQQINNCANTDNQLKLLVVVGFNTSTKPWMQALKETQEIIGFPLLADIVAHYPYKNTILHYDNFLEEANPNLFRPDVLITTGNAVLSKNLRKFLRAYKPLKHFHIAATGHVGDPFQSLTQVLRVDPELFFKKLNTIKNSATTFHNLWSHAGNQIQYRERLNTLPFCEAKAAALILDKIPEGSMLQLSNSMPVRYALMFGVPNLVKVYGNRGTSGIDGCSSTAVGAAYASKKYTTLLTGDIAFFYDVNAFWNTLQLPNLRIVLLNNGGGGIFRLIQGPKELEELEVFLENSHARTAMHIARDFNFHYTHVASEAELKAALEIFYQESYRPKILEIFTDKFVNEEAYANLKSKL